MSQDQEHTSDDDPHDVSRLPERSELPEIIDPAGPPQAVKDASKFQWIPAMMIGGGMLVVGGSLLQPRCTAGATRSCRIEWTNRQIEIARAADIAAQQTTNTPTEDQTD